jgi:hypothetical protein
VMGLPLCHLYRLLRELRFELPQIPVTACNDLNDRTCDIASEILGTLYVTG